MYGGQRTLSAGRRALRHDDALLGMSCRQSQGIDALKAGTATDNASVGCGETSAGNVLGNVGNEHVAANWDIVVIIFLTNTMDDITFVTTENDNRSFRHGECTGQS